MSGFNPESTGLITPGADRVGLQPFFDRFPDGNIPFFPGAGASQIRAIRAENDSRSRVSGGVKQEFNDYINNAYGGIVPARLKSTADAVNAGRGVSDRAVSRIILDDAKFGGSLQDHGFGISAANSIKGVLGNPFLSLGGPGGNSVIDVPGFERPVATANAGPGTSRGASATSDLLSQLGVPVSVAERDLAFNNRLQQDQIDSGTVVTDNLGLGGFGSVLGIISALAPFVPGLQPLGALGLLSNIAGAVENRDIIGGILSTATPALNGPVDDRPFGNRQIGDFERTLFQLPAALGDTVDERPFGDSQPEDPFVPLLPVSGAAGGSSSGGGIAGGISSGASSESVFGSSANDIFPARVEFEKLLQLLMDQENA